MKANRMRVLMSTDTVGGVWSYALELARGLAAHGVEVQLATLGSALSEDQKRAAAAIPQLQVHQRECPLEWMQEPWEALDAAGEWLLELERELEPDVVHLNHYCHGPLPWAAPVLMVAHSCVYSWHHWVQQRLPGAEWARYRQAVTEGLRSADLVVAPSGAMLADAERFYGPFRQARVIANGRRPEDFPPAAKAARIVCAGRLWDEAKNSLALAAVAPQLSWPVEIIGNAAHPDGGQARHHNVALPGVLGQAELARRLGQASIYAHPARYEPFGLAPLEAALAGCALVLGDIPSLREIWGDTAVFVEPDDQGALAAAIQQLIDQPELRADYAQRARARAQHFSTERMAWAYLHSYRRLLQPAPSRQPLPLRTRFTASVAGRIA